MIDNNMTIIAAMSIEDYWLQKAIFYDTNTALLSPQNIEAVDLNSEQELFAVNDFSIREI